MKNINISIYIFLLFSLFLLSCSQNLPESYGVYAYTDKGRITLSGQKIFFRGNLMQSITGLQGASGIECKSIKYLIVYEKDINPKMVRLTKLAFKRRGYVQNLFGNDSVEVNLWVQANNVNFDVAPVEGEKDMYKLIPKEKLPEGLYALHFGGLENIPTLEASIGNIAYDFVIGNATDYPSYEIIKKNNEEKIKTEAENILKTMNNYFNNKDYIKMREIYRPDGRVFSDSEWQEFTKGLSTWLNESGEIKESKIINSNISENAGVFEVQTTYAKKGQQKEKFVVTTIEGKYFITSLE